MRIPGGCEVTARVPVGLGPAVAWELYLRGAETLYVAGEGACAGLAPVSSRPARTRDEHDAVVVEELATGYDAGVFSAAVADVGPVGSPPNPLTLKRGLARDVVEEVGCAHPTLPMVTFHYDEGTDDDRVRRARTYLDRFPCVVAHSVDNPLPAWLVTRDADPVRIEGTAALAVAVADHLARVLSIR